MDFETAIGEQVVELGLSIANEIVEASSKISAQNQSLFPSELHAANDFLSTVVRYVCVILYICVFVYVRTYMCVFVTVHEYIW